MRIQFIVNFILLALTSKCQLTSDYVDQYSTTSTFVITQKGKQILKIASCFFIQVKSVTYLITNNHVVGAEYYIAEYKRFHKDSLPPKDSFPDNLVIRLYNKNLGKTYNESISLYDKKGNPLFFKFFDNENNSKTILDVIAIPLLDINNVTFKHPMALTSSNLNPRLPLYPGCELFVVGFPNEYGSNNYYPIWKKGTIASEANFIEIGQSKFYIDATTRGGMSGSPVFFRSSSMITNGGNYSAGNLFTYLVGIYSAQNYDSELGVVTRIEKIFDKLNAITK